MFAVCLKSWYFIFQHRFVAPAPAFSSVCCAPGALTSVCFEPLWSVSIPSGVCLCLVDALLRLRGLEPGLVGASHPGGRFFFKRKAREVVPEVKK